MDEVESAAPLTLSEEGRTEMKKLLKGKASVRFIHDVDFRN